MEKEEKERLYDKLNPLLNGIIGRLTVASLNSPHAAEAHEMAIDLANLLDDWINE